MIWIFAFLQRQSWERMALPNFRQTSSPGPMGGRKFLFYVSTKPRQVKHPLVNIFFWCQWCDAWIKYNGKIWEHQKWSYWHVQDDIQKAQQGWPQKKGTIIFHVLTSLFGGMSFIYVDCPNSGGVILFIPWCQNWALFAFFSLDFLPQSKPWLLATLWPSTSWRVGGCFLCMHFDLHKFNIASHEFLK